METLEQAISIALEAHKGQKNKAGEPYILHPIRVMMKMDTELEKVAAVLHDVIEDNPATKEIMKAIGMSKKITDIVEALTKKKGEEYSEYIKRCGENEIARKIKIADIEDNLDMRRLNKIKGEDEERINKYLEALRYLKEEK